MCAHLSGRQVEVENVAYDAVAHGGSELGNQGHSSAVVPLHHLLGPRNERNHSVKLQKTNTSCKILHCTQISSS